MYERPHSAFDETREFFFKHTLLRDVTYDSVLKSHRLTYHALVAAMAGAGRRAGAAVSTSTRD